MTPRKPLDKPLIYHSQSCLLSATAEPLTAAILDCVWPHSLSASHPASGRTAPPHYEHPLKTRNNTQTSIKPTSVFTKIQIVYLNE